MKSEYYKSIPPTKRKLKKQIHFEGILDSLRAETAEKRKFEKQNRLKTVDQSTKPFKDLKAEIVSLQEEYAKLP